MLTKWEYSSKTEAERLLHCAHQMAVGFYKINNFIVLPYTQKIKNSHLVTFVDLPFNKIPRFWEKAKSIDITTLPIRVDKKLAQDTQKMLDRANLLKPEFTEIQKNWQKAEKDIISEIYKLMPIYKNRIRKIVIYPTIFGTSCSFNLISKNGEIVIYLREDMGIFAITEAIITSLTRADAYKDLGGVWQESELLTDWLVTKSSISNVIKKFTDEEFLPTIKGVRIKEQANLIDLSNKFYKKIGINFSKKVFGLNGLTPEINKKPIENLNSNEKKLMKILIQNENEVVEIDKIGGEIFGVDTDYSLYAISKMIERLRTKLEANGISGSYIQTLRGKGYLLKN